MDYKVAPLSREKICFMAEQMRQILGHSDIVQLPIVDIMEKVLDKIIPEFNWHIVHYREMPDKHAETIPEECLIRIREDIYEGACNGLGRDRMTIAHEIAHILLHSDQRPSFARAFKDYELPGYCSAEWQAKAFAGELLVPRKLCGGMTVFEIADKCGVSLDAAQYQYNKSTHI